MKVFHLINTLSVGGAELHLLTLCRRQVRAGLQVVVGCLREFVTGSRPLASDFEREGVRVIRLKAESRLDPRFFPALRRHLRREAPDVLHSHLPRADLAAALARGRARRPAWVSSVHDVYSRSWSGRWALPLFDFVWRRADAVIAVSDAVRDWLAAERRLPAGRVTVIRYGIEPGAFAVPAADLRAAWGLRERLIIGTIGRLEPRKGHDVLIKAMPAVRRDAPSAMLLIAGHDPWRYSRVLERLVAGLGLRDCVRLVGFQPDVASFLHATDIFAFATRAEGFGQVLLEAMDAGRPVVASRIPPLTEIVEDPSAGILVPVEDSQAFAAAVTMLAAHPAQRNAMGERGRERVRTHFSAERMAQETSDLYLARLGVP